MFLSASGEKIICCTNEIFFILKGNENVACFRLNGKCSVTASKKGLKFWHSYFYYALKMTKVFDGTINLPSQKEPVSTIKK